MKPYIEWTKEELVAEKARLEQEFAEVKAKGLNLNISRGKEFSLGDLGYFFRKKLSPRQDALRENPPCPPNSPCHCTVPRRAPDSV